MIVLTGGCNKCGKLMQSEAFDISLDETPSLICNDCYNRYYSPQALREQKLNSVLKKSIWQRLYSKIGK